MNTLHNVNQIPGLLKDPFVAMIQRLLPASEITMSYHLEADPMQKLTNNDTSIWYIRAAARWNKYLCSTSERYTSKSHPTVSANQGCYLSSVN